MSSIVAGKYYICQMAKYAGVDCTPNEIFIDQVIEGQTDPNEETGTPSTAVRNWFIMAAKDVDGGAIADPEKYYGEVYDNMSGFAKLMIANWYWYTDLSSNNLHGCDYLWGGQCYYVPDDLDVSEIDYKALSTDTGNSLPYFKESCIGRSKRYGFDCAGLVRTMTSDVLPNGIAVSGNSTSITFGTYGGIANVYGGYYNGNNSLGIGPLFKGAYTFDSSSDFSKIPVTLQPFDILGHSGHVLFFICWIDQSSGTMLTLEASSSNSPTGLHKTTIRGSLKGTVGLLQFDHSNAYKYIMSDKRCTNPASNATEDSSHNSWNSAKNVLASTPEKMGFTGNGAFLNSSYLAASYDRMTELNF